MFPAVSARTLVAQRRQPVADPQVSRPWNTPHTSTVGVTEDTGVIEPAEGAVPPLTAIEAMPEAMIEQWRIVSPSESVDAAQDASDCDTTDLDVAGLIGTIRPDGFSYFEEGGTLIVVHEVSEGRIDATFDTTYVEINESRPVFELRDDADYNGPVLRVTPADDSFFVDVVDHVRCSSGATDVGSPPAGYFSPSSAWKNS